MAVIEKMIEWIDTTHGHQRATRYNRDHQFPSICAPQGDGILQDTILTS